MAYGRQLINPAFPKDPGIQKIQKVGTRLTGKRKTLLVICMITDQEAGLWFLLSLYTVR